MRDDTPRKLQTTTHHGRDHRLGLYPDAIQTRDKESIVHLVAATAPDVHLAVTQTGDAVAGTTGGTATVAVAGGAPIGVGQTQVEEARLERRK